MIREDCSHPHLRRTLKWLVLGSRRQWIQRKRRRMEMMSRCSLRRCLGVILLSLLGMGGLMGIWRTDCGSENVNGLVFLLHRSWECLGIKSIVLYQSDCNYCGPPHLISIRPLYCPSHSISMRDVWFKWTPTLARRHNNVGGTAGSVTTPA